MNGYVRWRVHICTDFSISNFERKYLKLKRSHCFFKKRAKSSLPANENEKGRNKVSNISQTKVITNNKQTNNSHSYRCSRFWVHFAPKSHRVCKVLFREFSFTIVEERNRKVQPRNVISIIKPKTGKLMWSPNKAVIWDISEHEFIAKPSNVTI